MGKLKAFPMEGYDDGMDLRDYFAAKAMQGMVAHFGDPVNINQMKTLADTCYTIADSMLKAREEVSNG